MRNKARTLFSKKYRDFLLLHFNIFLFSFTGVFSKLASGQLSKYGLTHILLYFYIVMMLINCLVYAIIWQVNIEKMSLSTAYANRSVYILWTQLWAFLFFSENFTVNNYVGIVLVIIGIIMVQKNEK